MLHSFKFNSLEHSDDDLTVLIGEMFLQVAAYKIYSESARLCMILFLCFQLASQQEISISVENLKTFILAVRPGMPSNQYHNWKHVVDVTQVH